MGRWSQTRRSGGGVSTPLVITHALRGLDDELEVQFSGNVVAAWFDLADFTTNVTLQNPTSITLVGANALLLSFAAIITTDVTLTYAGNAPNVASPQTVTIEDS